MKAFLILLIVCLSGCGTVHVNVKKSTCQSRGTLDGDEIERCEVAKKVL